MPTIKNTNGYQTRSYQYNIELLGHGSVHRIYKDVNRLIHEYLRLRDIRSVKQCSVVQKLYIILNANIGAIFTHGRLSQSIYKSALFVRKNLIELYGNDHKQARFAIKQINKYCQTYEIVCLSDNKFIPVELFRDIFSYY